MTERLEHNAADVPGSTAWFIERYGLISRSMPRTAGRLFALLLIESGPFSFSQLADRLQVSRGGISTSTRMLEMSGMIERVSRPGDRQDYFQAARNPWRLFLEQQISGQVKARGYAERLLEAQPDLPADAKQRIADMTALIDRSISFKQSMIAHFARLDHADGSEG